MEKITSTILFFITTAILVTSPIVNGEILYRNKLDMINDQLFSSDKNLENKEDSKSIYLRSLRYIGSENDSKIEIAKKNLYQLKDAGVLDAEYSLYSLRKRLAIPEGLAFSFLKESADNGYSISQLELAYLYYNGDQVNRDLVKYHEWIEKAAKAGNELSMRENALSYFSGIGVERNDVFGFQWMQKLYALSGRNFDDWELLGKVYETGRGTPVDLVKAYMCYDLEGTAGIEEKARIAPQMTSEQRAQGLRLAREWQEKNHVYTMQSLGLSRQKDGSYR